MSLAAKWLILVLLLLVTFGLGLHTGVSREQGEQAKLEVKRQKAESDALAQFWVGQRAMNAKTAADLESARQDRDKYRRSLAKRNVQRETLVDVVPPSPPTAGVPAVPAAARLSTIGVREWNLRLALGLSEADRGRWTDAANTGAGPVEVDDAIQNVEDNAAILGECRARELGWQRKACAEGWWVGPPCTGAR